MSLQKCPCCGLEVPDLHAHMVGDDLFEKMAMKDLSEKPYMVIHEEAEGYPPTYATWKEALAAQVAFNKSCPGHKAMKR